jgi:hypothetical protein
MYDNENKHDAKAIRTYLDSKKIRLQFSQFINTFSTVKFSKDQNILKLTKKFPRTTFVLLSYGSDAMYHEFYYFLAHHKHVAKFKFTPDKKLISKIDDAEAEAAGIIDEQEEFFSRCEEHKESQCYDCNSEFLEMIEPSDDISQCYYTADCHKKDALKKQIKTMGLIDLSKIIKLVAVTQGESNSDDSDSSNESDCSDDSDGFVESDSSEDSSDSDAFNGFDESDNSNEDSSSDASDSSNEDKKKPIALFAKKIKQKGAKK